jgi:hypothetical protein
MDRALSGKMHTGLTFATCGPLQVPVDLFEGLTVWHTAVRLSRASDSYLNDFTSHLCILGGWLGL